MAQETNMSMIDSDDRERMRDEAEARKRRLAAAVPPVPPRETTAVRRDDPEAVIRRLRAKLTASTTATEPCVSQGEAEAVATAFNAAPIVDGRRWKGGEFEDERGVWFVTVFIGHV